MEDDTGQIKVANIVEDGRLAGLETYYDGSISSQQKN